MEKPELGYIGVDELDWIPDENGDYYQAYEMELYIQFLQTEIENLKTDNTVLLNTERIWVKRLYDVRCEPDKLLIMISNRYAQLNRKYDEKKIL